MINERDRSAVNFPQTRFSLLSRNFTTAAVRRCRGGAKLLRECQKVMAIMNLTYAIRKKRDFTPYLHGYRNLCNNVILNRLYCTGKGKRATKMCDLKDCNDMKPAPLFLQVIVNFQLNSFLFLASYLHIWVLSLYIYCICECMFEKERLCTTSISFYMSKHSHYIITYITHYISCTAVSRRLHTWIKS